MPSGSYRIYAVQYADRETSSSEVFLGDTRNEPMRMAYFVWAVTDGNRTVVVDLGFTEQVGTRRGRNFLRSSDDGLRLLGVDPASVEQVIVTHFHYDHVGTHASFPNATFYVQDREMQFWTGRYSRQPAFSRSLEPDDVVAFVRYNWEGRVHFVDSEAEIMPGIRVLHVGGHTAGMQIVTVETSRGTAVLTSDASHYYANIEQGIPFGTLHDIPGVYNGFARIRELASKRELILPGHDPAVCDRLTTAGDRVYEL
jgi:glyoxylase-like metal-dependent hydrolase (beta-lactamase superfamily II)